MTHDEITQRFNPTTKATPDEQRDHRTVSEYFANLALAMLATLPAGRDRAFVLTKLEEASFFAHQAIALAADAAGDRS